VARHVPQRDDMGQSFVRAIGAPLDDAATRSYTSHAHLVLTLIRTTETTAATDPELVAQRKRHPIQLRDRRVR